MLRFEFNINEYSNEREVQSCLEAPVAGKEICAHGYRGSHLKKKMKEEIWKEGKGLHRDSFELNELFTSMRLEGMLEGKEYSISDTVLSFIDVSLELDLCSRYQLTKFGHSIG